MLTIGRVCIKTAGREAGRACVVIDTIDETYVMVTGPKTLTRVRRRKCNIAHLEPLEYELKLGKNAPDGDVERLLKEGKVLESLSLGKPIARPKRPREEKGEAKPREEKKSFRERIMGRGREGKPKEEKEEAKKEQPEKPKAHKEKPKAGRKAHKPKHKATKAKKAKPAKKPKAKKK